MNPRVLVVDDHPPSAQALAEALADLGYDAVTAGSGAEALASVREAPVDVVITDLRMDGMDGVALLRELRAHDPGLPVILVTAYATVERAVEATRAGAFCFLTKPLKLAEVEVQVRHAVGVRRLEAAAREPAADDPDPILGRSPALLGAVAIADRAAASDATVLILGETGTGKELFARRIHRRSRRARGPFVAVNAGSLPDSLVESELFGHAKGAFTGAQADRAGLFEAANRGTLFLDEIAELSGAAQTRLLRVLQEHTLRRVGETADRRVDVRVIAATHRDVAHSETFRRDLYFRLDVVTIELPPLRARPEDVPILFGVALRKACERMGRPPLAVAGDVLDRLVRHRWPGNVRELLNVAERVAVLVGGDTVTVADLPRDLGEPGTADAARIPVGDFDLTAWLESVEEGALRRALASHDGVKARAAASLGLERNAFRYKLKKYGIEE
jgi:two-component system response regulator HydG